MIMLHEYVIKEHEKEKEVGGEIDNVGDSP